MTVKMQDLCFGVHRMFSQSFFLWSEQNFTIGQIHTINGNFSKICIKINKNLKKLRRNLEKKIKFFVIF